MAAPAGDARVVYFGNLKDGLTVDEIRAVASRAGAVADIAFGSERKRHAYVTYTTAAAASSAIATLHDADLAGRPVRVEASRPPLERPARSEHAAAPAAASGAPRASYKERIAVRNLPREMDKEGLEKAFAQFGTVTKVRFDRALGYVSFAEPAQADAAFALDGTTMSGATKPIKIEYALVPLKRKPAGTGAAPAPAAGGRAAASSRPAASAAPAAPREARPVSRVRVDGLEGSNATPDQLKAHFAGAGRIESAKTIRDTHGFIKFESDAGASKALALSGSTINGKPITVTLDVPRSRREGGDAAGAVEAGAGRRRVADAEAAPEPVRVNSVWIGGLTEGVTEDALRAHFSRFGAIKDVEFARSGRFAYIAYTADVVDAAVAGSAALTLAGTALKVDKAQPRPEGGAPRRRRGPRGPRAE